MHSPAPKQPSPEAAPDLSALQLAEVRYSLPQMLAELKLERTSGVFAMEKLDQNEIGKLFKAKATRRAKPKQ
jgi:hypothetical protein